MIDDVLQDLRWPDGSEFSDQDKHTFTAAYQEVLVAAMPALVHVAQLRPGLSAEDFRGEAPPIASAAGTAAILVLSRACREMLSAARKAVFADTAQHSFDTDYKKQIERNAQIFIHAAGSYIAGLIGVIYHLGYEQGREHAHMEQGVQEFLRGGQTDNDEG